jgi:hypothetical protein
MLPATFQKLCDAVQLEPRTSFMPSLSDEHMIATFIMRLSGTMTCREIGARMGISDSSVVRCTERVCEAMLDPGCEVRRAIVHPFRARYNEPGGIDAVAAGFDLHGFKHVAGALDGCHIPLRMPMVDKVDWINRKGWTSMILQGMCDHEGLFSDIFVGFPGSAHDARVYHHSSIGRFGRLVIPTPYYVLADAAYPLSPHCLTPYRSHAAFVHSESNYNKRHAKSRSHLLLLRASAAPITAAFLHALIVVYFVCLSDS